MRVERASHRRGIGGGIPIRVAARGGLGGTGRLTVVVAVIVHSLVMMVTMRALRLHRTLHVLDQGFEGVLGTGGIIRLQSGLEGLEVIAERAIIVEKPAQRISSIAALQIVLERGQGVLGIRQIPGLNGAADTFEIAE